MVCSRAQEQPSSGQEERPQLLWLAELTGAHIGLAPIPQDAQDRCSIWENLVSLVDFQCPGFPLTSEELCSYIDVPRTPSSSSSSSVGSVTATLPQAASWPPGLPEDVDYKTNGELKPPYSYSTLIRMAMEASEEPKLTLAAICEWIRDNFCYFRRAHPGWQSSVRHNLCINKRFVKVPREKGEPGRGAFWKLHPRYAQRLKDGTSGGSRTLPDLSIPPAPSRRTQHGARRVPSPAASACGLEVGAELQRLLREFEEFESSQGRDPAGQRGSEGPGSQGRDPAGQRGSEGPGSQGRDPAGQWGPEGPGSDPAGQRGSEGPGSDPAGQRGSEGQGSQGRDPAGQRGSAGPGSDPAGQRGSAGPGRDPAGQRGSEGPGSPEEPGALTELRSGADWEALLELSPEQGDFCPLEQLRLSPFSLPGEFSPRPEREPEQSQGWAQGQQRGLAEPGSDETLLATAFLEAAWPQETGEESPGSVPAGRGAADSRGSALTGWGSLRALSLC